MKILHLTLKKKWFDMIASGEKKEEYREIKDYWSKRFGYYYETDRESGYWDEGTTAHYDVVRFRNGYSKNAPVMDVEFIDMEMKLGKPEWGAEPGKKYFVIELGEII